MTGNTLKLAAIALAQGNLSAAATALAECHAVATRHHDPRRLAEYHWLNGQLYAAQGNEAAAQAERQTAIELFKRTGMKGNANERLDKSRQ